MKSMTGYAKSDFNIEANSFSLEIKSYNSKNLDIFLKFPKCFDHIEIKVKNLIAEYISRGKVMLTINMEENDENQLVLDQAKLNEAIGILSSIRDALGSQRELTVSDVLRMRYILKETHKQFDETGLENTFWPELKKILEMFNDSRKREADKLREDIGRRIEAIRDAVCRIEELDNNPGSSPGDKLHEKINTLLNDSNKELELDKNRFEQEVLYYILKYDIKEELVRLRSHLDLLSDYINLDKPVGKAITFILQEILRESNTICSKTVDIEIKNEGLTIKVETERIREQANNIE